MLAPVSRCILGKNKAAWISTCRSPSFLLRERPPGVVFFFSEATASAADDTLRKPLSRLLCVTLTVMQANRQTQTHSTHTLLLVELAKKIKKAQFSNVWKIQMFVLLFQSGRKGSFFRFHWTQLFQPSLLPAITSARARRGESLLVSGSAPLCQPHRPRVESLG